MGGIDAQSQVVIFTGLPGTGKSTLAEQVARTVGAPAFAGDWLMGGLKPAHAALAKIEEDIDRERDKIMYDVEFTACADVADYVERPHVPQFAHNATGDRMETDGRIAIVHLNGCEAPHVTKWVGDPLPVHGNPFQRIARRQILSIRSDYYRENLYWRTYEGGRWLVAAIRTHVRGNEPEPAAEPKSSDTVATSLLTKARNSSWAR